MHRFALLATLAALLSGCAAKAPRPTHLPNQASHVYTVTAQGKDGRPVPNVLVTGRLLDYAEIDFDDREIPAKEKTVTCKTDSAGQCSLPIEPILFQHYRESYPPIADQQLARQPFPHGGKDIWGYLSHVNAVGSIAGFLSGDTVNAAWFSNDERPQRIKVTTVVPQPADYFCDELKSPERLDIAARISKWVLSIHAAAEIRAAQLRSICIADFKGKSYLTFALKSDFVFNELKLNSYGVATRMFDDVVRKMLGNFIGATGSFPMDGYHVWIGTAMKPFIGDDKVAKPLLYDYYMPRDVVAKYTAHDISGQSLIDSSIVLLNGERIDVRLQ